MSRVVALVGPTAAGKSAASLEIAERTGALIVSVDSMLVYRGMNIGTAKPTPDEMRRVPHAMIDVAEPEEEYSVARFQAEARDAIAAWDGPVLLVGGSGLHLRAVVDPLLFPPTDPEVRAEVEGTPSEALVAELLAADPAAPDLVDIANPRRVARAVEIWRLTGRTPSDRSADPLRRSVESYQPEIPFRGYGIDPGEALDAAVASRVETMRSAGLLEEVDALRHRLGPTASRAVGYRQLLGVVGGLVDPEVGFADMRRATIALARRQRTFFRRDPRIMWISEVGRAVERIVTEMEFACVS